MPTCAAVKRDGTPCTFNARGTDTYCGHHKHLSVPVPVPVPVAAPAPAPKVCVAIKASNGKRCVHPASHGSYCGHHIPLIDKQQKQAKKRRQFAKKTKLAEIQNYSTQYAGVIKLYIDMYDTLDHITTPDELIVIIQNEHTYYQQLTDLELCLKRLGIQGRVEHAAITFSQRVRLSTRYVQRIAELTLVFADALTHPHITTATYVPDPAGGINLAAFATDSQSVHRSSVQTTAQAQIEHLLRTTTTVSASDAIAAAIKSSTLPTYLQQRTVTAFLYDYTHIQAFGHMYGTIANHVWTYIDAHKDKDELVRRLVEELVDGYQQCSNGKMVRLLNTLQGFDSGFDLSVAPPSKELFQHKFAMVATADAIDRELAAQQLFREFEIPETEQTVWIDALRAY